MEPPRSHLILPFWAAKTHWEYAFFYTELIHPKNHRKYNLDLILEIAK